jgi:hypothetical protein
MDIYEVWPINMESGPAFLIFLLFFSGVALGGAGLIGAILGSILESGEATGIAVGPAQPPGPNNPYRRPGPAEGRKRLAIGWVPLPEDAWAIAYLRDGQKGVAEALFAAAVALGWITRTPAGLVVNAQGRPSDPLLGALHGMLHPGPTTYLAVR